MKKMIIAAAIICAAAMSQAAVVNWASNQIKLGTTTQKGITVELYLVNYDGLGHDLKIDSRTTTTAGATANQGKIQLGAGTTQDPYVFGANTKDSVNFTISDTSKIYAIAYSSDGKYTQTTAEAALTGLSATQQASVTFTFGSATGTTVGTWVESSPEPPEPTPEPTSGLLIALGMAGLALRRRSA